MGGGGSRGGWTSDWGGSGPSGYAPACMCPNISKSCCKVEFIHEDYNTLKYRRHKPYTGNRYCYDFLALFKMISLLKIRLCNKCIKYFIHSLVQSLFQSFIQSFICIPFFVLEMCVISSRVGLQSWRIGCFILLVSLSVLFCCCFVFVVVISILFTSHVIEYVKGLSSSFK